MSSIFHRIFHLILVVFICFAQFGCEGSRNPPDSVIKEAIELKIGLTHRALDELLDLDDETTEVVRVKLVSSSHTSYMPGNLVAINGYFDCKFPGYRKELDVPFQIILERGDKGQSWRLANASSFKDGLPNEWTTYPLPIKNHSKQFKSMRNFFSRITFKTEL